MNYDELKAIIMEDWSWRQKAWFYITCWIEERVIEVKIWYASRHR